MYTITFSASFCVGTMKKTKLLLPFERLLSFRPLRLKSTVQVDEPNSGDVAPSISSYTLLFFTIYNKR